MTRLTPDPEPHGSHYDDEQKFVESLVLTGQLVDVNENEDTTKLPARITHVRYPNGTIRRIRFTGPARP